MFLKQSPTSVNQDLSLDLRDVTNWEPGLLQTFEYCADVTALAIDPITSVLAVGPSFADESRVGASLILDRHCWWNHTHLWQASS